MAKLSMKQMEGRLKRTSFYVENMSINVNSDPSEMINIKLDVRSNVVPKNIDEIEMYMGNAYLALKGIPDSLDEILEKYYQEYLV